MATNPYFQEYSGERDLLDDLTVETIRIMGRDMVYLPREFLKKDLVFGEDPISQFKKGHQIEMYIQNVQSFSGQINLINKFGLNITDRVTLQVAKTRFNTEIVSKYGNIKAPREGDLIFFPFNNSIFEINYVEDKIPFFQFGILTTYTLTCELFTYSYETIDTGITEIDEVADVRSYNFLKATLQNPPISGSAFQKGQYVFQVDGLTGINATFADSTAAAYIVDVTSNYILLRDINGTFLSGDVLVEDGNGNTVSIGQQTIKGVSFDSEYIIAGITETNIMEAVDPTQEKDYTENDYYSDQAREEILFTPNNPFSEECS